PVRMIVGGVAAALLTGGVVVLRSHRTGQISVSIAANVVGAAISVGGKNCVTPDCSLELQPGNYTLHANGNGYEPLTRDFALKDGQSELKLELTLKPVTRTSAASLNVPAPASTPTAQEAPSTPAAPAPHSPAMARLEIAGAVAGAQVKVDGQSI